MSLYPENMHRDLDVYLGIAQQVAAGEGFCVPGTAQPTAFRPPLYPLLLALTGPQRTAGRVLLHLLLGGLTIVFTWQAATKLGFSCRARSIAAGLLVIDPLLIWYTSFPMTEAICTCLSAGMLVRLTDNAASSPRKTMLTGGLFGLCVLCRPTYWVWGGLLAIWWCVVQWQHRRDPSHETVRKRLRISLATLCGLMLCVSPWGIRNWAVMGTPILMTTHGGYTLLLANNPNFYAEVVEQPWGTTWSGEGLAHWNAEMQEQMQRAGVRDEVAVDHWQGRSAREFIQAHPSEFARACLHRVRMFWNIVPSGEAAAPFPTWLLIGVGCFYGGWWLLVIAGLSMIIARRDMRCWWPILLLVVSFTAVHAVYWSNMRLRAPVLPAVALLAAVPFTSIRSRQAG